MNAYLEVVAGSNVGSIYPLTKPEVVIGRKDPPSPQRDIEINDLSVSRSHARLAREGEGFFIEDLGSRNFTRVNGQKISRVVLRDCDRVEICSTVLVYHGPPYGSWIEQADYCSTVSQSLDLSSYSGASLKSHAAEKLRAIVCLSQALALNLELHQVLDRAVDSLLQIFGNADRVLVLLREGNRLMPALGRNRKTDDEPIRFSRTVIAKAMQERKAFLCEDAAANRQFSSSESLMDLKIRSLMCAPLLSHRPDAIGAIQVDTLRRRHAFTADDLEVLTAVAGQVALAAENAWLLQETLRQARLERELQLAEAVQRSLLPRKSPEVEGYDFQPFYQAAGRVGGDYYDFVPLPDNRQVVLLADVSGKGMPAALLMARASNVCRSALLAHPDSLTAALAVMNDEVCDLTLDGGFVTLVLCSVSSLTHEIQIATAGHMWPIIRRRKGALEEPTDDNLRGIALGIEKGHSFNIARATLDPGDCVVLYSDGITDALNSQDQRYTEARLRRRLAELTEHEPGRIGRALVDDVAAHRGECEPADDITLVIVGRMGH
jgi:phosphoserine phosphatase RsbU/P